MRDRETLGERFAYWLYAAMEWVATRLPEAVARRLFAWAGALGYRLKEGERAVVESNLARVLGEKPGSPVLEEAVREAFGSYARYWFDTFRIRALSDEEFVKRFDFQGMEHIEAGLEAGKGLILALPHMGNWDAAGRYVTGSGHRMTAVAETLRPKRLFDLFYRHRRALGIGVVALSEERRVGEELVRLLGKNEILALVADRDLKGTGVKVEMFGATRRLPAGPALLSLATGAPLLPCSTFDTEDGWQCIVHPPLEIERTGDMRTDVTELTRKLAGAFERTVAAAPTQWHMWAPAWPEDEAAADTGPERHS